MVSRPSLRCGTNQQNPHRHLVAFDSAAWTVTRIPLQLAVDVRGRLADIAGAIPARITFLTIGERNVKLIVLDFIGGNCHIFTVTKELCESEYNIIDFLIEKDFNLDNIQYMYGEINVQADVAS
jgi:hypothetical protein